MAYKTAPPPSVLAYIVPRSIRPDPRRRRDTESILRGLELIHDGHLLNAAVVLIGKSDRLKSLYDDHLEVVNPGGLHVGITPQKLARPHESQPWNPIIANVFYWAGIIDALG